MSIFVLDTFTGTLSNKLTYHHGEIGADWVALSPFVSADIKAYDNYTHMLSGSNSGNIASGTPHSADYEVEIKIRFTQVNHYGGVGIVVRAVGSTYYLFYSFGGYLYLYTVVNGTRTLLGSNNMGVGFYPMSMKLVITGGRLEGYANEVLRLTRTNTDITAAGQIGFLFEREGCSAYIIEITATDSYVEPLVEGVFNSVISSTYDLQGKIGTGGGMNIAASDMSINQGAKEGEQGPLSLTMEDLIKSFLGNAGIIGGFDSELPLSLNLNGTKGNQGEINSEVHEHLFLTQGNTGAYGPLLSLLLDSSLSADGKNGGHGSLLSEIVLSSLFSGTTLINLFKGILSGDIDAELSMDGLDGKRGMVASILNAVLSAEGKNGIKGIADFKIDDEESTIKGSQGNSGNFSSETLLSALLNGKQGNNSVLATIMGDLLPTVGGVLGSSGDILSSIDSGTIFSGKIGVSAQIISEIEDLQLRIVEIIFSEKIYHIIISTRTNQVIFAQPKTGNINFSEIRTGSININVES